MRPFSVRSIGRFLALLTALTFFAPSPVLALRARSAGLEEPTPVTAELENRLRPEQSSDPDIAAGLEEWGESVWNRLYELGRGNAPMRLALGTVLDGHMDPPDKLRERWDQVAGMAASSGMDPALQPVIRAFRDRWITAQPIWSATLLYDRDRQEGVLVVGDEGRRIQLTVALVGSEPHGFEVPDSSRWEFLTDNTSVLFAHQRELVGGLDPLQQEHARHLYFDPPLGAWDAPRQGVLTPRMKVKAQERFVPIRRLIWLTDFPENNDRARERLPDDLFRVSPGATLEQAVSPPVLAAVRSLRATLIQSARRTALSGYRSKAVPRVEQAGLKEPGERPRVVELSALRGMEDEGAAGLAQAAGKAGAARVVLIPEDAAAEEAALQTAQIHVYREANVAQAGLLALLPVGEQSIVWHEIPSGDLAGARQIIGGISPAQLAILALSAASRADLGEILPPEGHPLTLLIDPEWSRQMPYRGRLAALLSQPLDNLRNLVLLLSGAEDPEPVRIQDRNYTTLFA